MNSSFTSLSASTPSGITSRRSFLKGALASVSMLSGIGMMGMVNAEEGDAIVRAKKLLESCMAIDMHSHVGGSSARHVLNDFSTIQSGGLSAVCMSLVSDSTVISRGAAGLHATREPRPGELYANMSARLDYADRAIKSNALRRITTLTELQACKRDGVAGIILATEGSDFIEGDLSRLQTVYERGVRHIQLVHYRQDNGIGDIQTEASLYHGAASLGLDIVRTCNRLGMVVDVAHATLDMVKQVASISTTPLILSHTALNPAHKAFSRTIGIDHAKAVADTGGVVGVWTSGGSFHNYEDFARGIAIMAEAIGVDHVGIGTDLNGLPNPMFPGYIEFPKLVSCMFSHFNDDELQKILGGNYLRVFDQSMLQKTQSSL